MKLKKILALLMSTALLASALPLSASATEIDVVGGDGTGVKDSVTVTAGVMSFDTTLNMSDTAVTAPDVTFTYELTAGGEVTDVDYPQYDVIEGVMTDSNDDLIKTSYTADFDTDDYVTNGSVIISTEIDFSQVTYDENGVYAYVLTATATNEAGVIMDTNEVRYIYVYVQYDNTESDYVISEIIMFTEVIYTENTTDHEDVDDIVAHKSAGFTNSYGVVASGETDPDDGSDPELIPGVADGTATNDFIITSFADGSGADSSKEFEYTLTATGIDDGTIFKVVDGNGSTVYIKYVAGTDGSGTFIEVKLNEDETSYTEVTDDDDNTNTIFTLSSNEDYVIYSVVEGMSFTATMTDDDAEDYTIYNRNYDDSEDAHTNWYDGEGSIATNVSTTDSREVTVPAYTYDNTTEATIGTVTVGIDFLTHSTVLIPATGVIVQYLPFVLMGLLALGYVSFKFYSVSVKK